MLIELGSDVNVCVIDNIEDLLMHPQPVRIDEVRLEQNLRRLEALLPDFNDAAVRKLLPLEQARRGNGVRLDKHRRLLRQLLLNSRIEASTISPPPPKQGLTKRNTASL